MCDEGQWGEICKIFNNKDKLKREMINKITTKIKNYLLKKGIRNRAKHKLQSGKRYLPH